MLRDCWEGQGWLSMMLQEGILRSGTVCILTGLINLIEWLKDHDNWSFSLFSGGVMPAQGLAILLSLLEG